MGIRQSIPITSTRKAWADCQSETISKSPSDLPVKLPVTCCPVNMAGFISFPKPKGAGTDVGTIYDLENADHEVIISTFSTFGSPAFTMAYQTDSRKFFPFRQASDKRKRKLSCSYRDLCWKVSVHRNVPDMS